ncbi:hypothetical protein BH10PSE19_BH10PSE19_16590 [soil metagenome]
MEYKNIFSMENGIDKHSNLNEQPPMEYPIDIPTDPIPPVKELPTDKP